MPEQTPPPRESARTVLLFLLIFMWLTSDSQGPNPGYRSARQFATERLERSRHSLDVLNVTRWQDFSPRTTSTPGYQPGTYLNLTGFRKSDGYAWDRLDTFKERSELFSREAKGRWRADKDKDDQDGNSGLVGEIYKNVTGIVVGDWVRYSGDLEKDQRRPLLNLSEIAPGVPWAFRNEEFWTRNITGREGKLMLRLYEKDVLEIDLDTELQTDVVRNISNTGLAREVSAAMTVQDETSTGDGWEMKIHGVHWPRTGVMLMTTTSPKFSGAFGLPHLSTSLGEYASSQKLLNITLGKLVRNMERRRRNDPTDLYASTPDGEGEGMVPAPHCEFVIYVQIHPLVVNLATSSGYFQQQSIIEEIEQELRFPNGAPIPPIPRLQMSTVIFSPDCGFILESKGPPSFSPVVAEHLLGKKQEVWLHDIQSWLLLLAVVIFGQVLLLKIQSKEASTPSTTGRVSLYTIGIMLLADALMFLSLSLLSSIAPNLFPSALLVSFSALMSLGLGVRFVGAVYNVQEPERRDQLRTQQAAEAARVPTRPSATAGAAAISRAAGASSPTPPLRVSNPAPSNNIPIIIPSDQDIDAEISENINTTTATSLPTTNTPQTVEVGPQDTPGFGAVYVKFVLAILFLLFISVSAMSWSVPVRTAYIYLLSSTYLSFWIPQIRRNIIRNCRKALLWKFVVGQSVLRLLPFAYFFLKRDNILFAETDWKAFCVLAGWVWIQIWILAAQEVLGPRWGIPKGWTEEAWDYHPILREDNMEAGGLPIGLAQVPVSTVLERSNTDTSEDLGSRKKKDDTFRSVDCAICMQTIEVPVVVAGEDASSANSVVRFPEGNATGEDPSLLHLSKTNPTDDKPPLKRAADLEYQTEVAGLTSTFPALDSKLSLHKYKSKAFSEVNSLYV
ncbi:RING protein [Venustampulla echinocandica]|uniref:RING-type E3 ubiquitin transferase n=1 Tax=Venustampulla echinocandica TaxID=2656787 RepID=A0A370TVI3_9HELO|nr:RING protein [Venustampulla echinocandica]RDL39520.1 RING protein [Venustampulla echinocandica]